MNKELFKRMAGLISAFAITASSVLPSAAQAIEIADTRTEYDNIVHVIVELYGDPILAADTGDMGSDYLDTAAAQRRSQQLEALRKNAFGEILSIYPDAKLDFTYDAVFNGFSCTLPDELLDEAEDLPAIKNVTVSQKNQAPDLYQAIEGTGSYYFSSETGLTGKGKVIAIIDTELKTDHEMFAPLTDVSSVKLTKADIADAAQNRNLNFEIDPDSAYISSKIPYAISLVDPENRYNVENSDDIMYHGTHVCGIAAGNRVKPYMEEYENYVDMSGVAPDAQLIFMAGFTQEFDEIPSMDDNVAVAGIEDAIKLGADVISLSFGGQYSTDEQEDLYVKVLKNADNAGIVICCAGGNSNWPIHTPDNVERNSLNSPGLMDDMFTIAAASVLSTELNIIKLADGTKLPCSIMSPKSVNKDTEYEFVYCGTGSEEELKSANVKGKIALVDYFDYDRGLIAPIEEADKAGAAGLMFCSNDESYYNPYYEDENFFVIGTNIEGSKLIKAQEDNRLFFRTDTFMDFLISDMATFSSHGGLQSLELKPDISAPGENIYSASYSYTGYSYMDGTSMATPFAAGCSVLAEQYIEKNGWDVSGAEKVSLVKNLLMNTADPVRKCDIPYSPRIQGAGLVNMEDLADCTVTMTNNGKASVCLGEKVGDNFSFDVTLHNYGSSEVVFNSADLEMIHETTEFSDLLNNDAISDTPAVLGSTASFSADTVKVPAGGEATLTVSVTLDTDDVTALNSVFTNGWFTEGYLTLSGADNCSDISIPITGFHGNWNSIPIIGKDYSADNTMLAENVLRKHLFGNYIPASASIAKALSLYKNRSAEDYCPNLDPAPRHGYVVSNSSSLTPSTSDFMQYNFFPNRASTIKEYTLTDENGNVYFESEPEERCLQDSEKILYIDPENTLKNGRYFLNITTELLQSPSEKVQQKKSIEITIDNDPPEFSDISIKKENGRKILTVTAKDPELEGFYITGTGKGCIKGSSDNRGYTADDIKKVLEFLDPTANYYSSSEGGVGSYGRNFTCSATFDDILFYFWLDESDNLSFDFIDAVPAEPDENGCMTIEYDITDLTDYTISVADRGYNIANYSEDAPLVSNIPGILEVKEDTPVSKLTVPTYSFDGKVTSKGWEYYDFYSAEWIPFEVSKKIDSFFHGEKIRYAVYSGDKAGYSNAAIISITNRMMIHVSVYADDQLLMDEMMYRGQQLDRMMFGYDKTTSYRVVMEAEGYVTRVMEFMGRNSPNDLDVYLYHLGDTNGDKIINISDITRTAAFVKGKKMLSDYEQKVADINNDGKINITDIIRLAAKVKGKRDFS